MRYLLDTNAVIALLTGRQPQLLAMVRKYRTEDFGLSAIVLHELSYGAYKSTRQEENLELLDRLQFEVLNFDKRDAKQAGEIRASLAKKGTPIGPYDALIAGQAKARNLILITSNTREFARVPGLRVQDWQTTEN